MTRETVLTVVVALVAVLAVGTAATTLEGAVSSDPGDVIEFDELPFGEELREEYLDSSGTDDAETGQPDESVDSGSQNGAGASTADRAGNSGSTDGDGNAEVGTEEASTDPQATGQVNEDPTEQPSSQQEEAEGARDSLNSASETNDAGDGSPAEQSGGGDGGTSGSDAPESPQDDPDTEDESPTSWLSDMGPPILVLLLVGGMIGLAFRWRARWLSLGDEREADAVSSRNLVLPREPVDPIETAWIALVRELEPDRFEALTTGDIAQLAIAAGYDPEAVRTVTGTFDAVQYGGAPVTEERVERVNRSIRQLRDAGGSS